MSLKGGLLPRLRCPFCRGSFSFDERPAPSIGRAEFGLLRCSCSIFPVVDGIPIVQRAPVGMFEHTRGTPEIDGIEIEALCRLIELGKTAEALLECLCVPHVPPRMAALLGWRLAHSPQVGAFVRWRARQRLLRDVVSRRSALRARDVLSFYYFSDQGLDPAVGHYFVRRFAQPRHLAALALCASVPSSDQPVLDIACGIGHLEHYLGSRADPVPVVGLDMNYYHLWVARHWIAPASDYVCGNVKDGLPFTDDSFSAVMSSDAYHYFPERASLLAEMRRCAPGKMVLLSRVGNAQVMPNEGDERSPAAYLAEFGEEPVRAFTEGQLLRSYLRRNDPFDEPTAHAAELSDCKWLSFVWNAPAAARRSVAADSVPPHAVGRLGVNPIYVQSTADSGELRLRFEFPNTWYAYENHDMLLYCPERGSLAPQQLQLLDQGYAAPLLRPSVDNFMVLGMPELF